MSSLKYFARQNFSFLNQIEKCYEENMPDILAELLEKEGHFKHALKMVNLGYYYWVPTTNELVWSDEIYHLLGVDPESGEAPSVELLLSKVHPDDRLYVQTAFGQVMETGTAPDLEYRLQHSEDKFIYVLARAELIADENGVPKYLFGTVQDVTERKEQQKKLEQALVVAEQASQAKSDFLSSVTHELRTPLNSILGYGELLVLSAQDTVQQECANEVMQAGQLLLNLVNQVLSFSELEANQIKPTMEWTSVQEEVKRCMALVAPMANKMSVNIDMEIDVSSPARIQTDRILLKQIMLNLLTNAIKYNREQGKVNIYVEPFEERVRICVKDSGIGIDVEQQQKLFKPFERLGQERGSIPGTGVGLVIARKLARNLGGDIEFCGTSDSGSCFCLNLP